MTMDRETVPLADSAFSSQAEERCRIVSTRAIKGGYWKPLKPCRPTTISICL